MKCERCGKELSDADLYCSRCGQAVFPEYMDETDVWAYYKSDEELEQILKEEQEKEAASADASEQGMESETSDTSVQETQPEKVHVEEKSPEKIKKGFWGRRKGKKTEEESVENPIEGNAGEADREESDTEETEEPKALTEAAEGQEEITEEAALETSAEERTEEEAEPDFAEKASEESEDTKAMEEAADEEETAKPTEGEIGPESSEEEPELEADSESGTGHDSGSEEKDFAEVPVSLESESAENPKAEELVSEAGEKPEAFPEEENFFAEEDEEDDGEEEEEEAEKQPLSPERRKKRRRTVLMATLFLVLCLAVGIALGFHKIKEMEQQEKEYYQEIGNKNSGETTKKEEAEPVVSTGEQEKEEPDPNPEKGSEKEQEPKEEKTPEKKKEEYFKLVKAEDIDFSKYKKIQPKSTEENSVKQSENYDYSAKSVVDGDTSTSWQENEEGIGEGKGMKLSLDGTHKIRYIVLYLGNWRSDELWQYNSRPKVLTMQVGDAQKKEVEFSDEKKKFCLSFEEPVEASYVSLYLKSAYEGSRWQDTCISEVELYE